jgi:hypothetical protein
MVAGVGAVVDLAVAQKEVAVEDASYKASSVKFAARKVTLLGVATKGSMPPF